MGLPSGITLEDVLAVALNVPAYGDPTVLPVQVVAPPGILTVVDPAPVIQLVSAGSAAVNKCIWGAPVLMWGPPGIGKTSRCAVASELTGLTNFHAVVPAVHNPEDFAGVPMSDGNGGFHLVPVLRAAKALAGKRGTLFLDEVSNAPGAVQAVLYRVVLERVIGDLALGGDCRVIAAANPPEMSASGYELAPPLANRFIHLTLDAPEAPSWAEWLLNAGSSNTNATDFEATVRARWADAWARARGTMAGFMRRRPDLLYMLPPEGHADRGRAFPTPRSWELATRCFATCLALYPDSRDTKGQMIREVLLEGSIGAGAAAELATFISDANLPDPQDVLAGKWSPDAHRLDINAAVVSSVAAFVTSHRGSDREDLAAKAWTVLGKVSNTGQADVIVPSARALINADLWNSPAVAPSANTVLGPLYRAGLIRARTGGR